jgi:lysophospholipase L1-like esterase
MRSAGCAVGGSPAPRRRRNDLHRRRPGRVVLIAVVALAVLAPGGAADAKARDVEVATWATSPQTPDVGGPSRAGFDDQTLREVVHTSVAGNAVRLRLSNAFGEQPVTFGAVRIAIRGSGAAVTAGTSRAVKFGGSGSVTIQPGADIDSDPVDLSVAAGQDLAVSLYLPSASGPATWHTMSLTTSYLASGNQTGDDAGTAFTAQTGSWFFLTGVEVDNADVHGTIVALGDSITDGYGSTSDANHRWTDYLAQRLNAAPAAQRRSIVNEGIGGNEILKDRACCGSQISALKRLDRDVLAQPGATDVILLEGINDIGSESATAAEVIGGMRQIISRVHARGLRIHGGTITPFGGNGSATPDRLAARDAVNDWIRTSGEFDSVIDFDRAVRDPANPQRLLARYDSGDHVHLVDAGYAALSAAVDLRRFSGKPTVSSGPPTAWIDGHFQIDTSDVVRRSNITLAQAPLQASQSMPIGNGKFGAAVWAADGFTAQLNRWDTFPDRRSPGQLTIPGLAAMTSAPDYHASVDLYDATYRQSGGGMTATSYIRADKAEMVIDVTGADPTASQTAQIDLQNGRHPTAATSGNVATLAETWVDTASPTGGTGKTYGSLAAITAGGRDVAADVVNSNAVKVSLKPKTDGSFRIVVGVPHWTGGDVSAKAASLLGDDANASADDLSSAHLTWWHRYWDKVNLIKLSSADGAADYMENLRTLFLYYEGSSERGKFPSS